MSKRTDLTNKKFGKLLVMEYSHTQKPKGISFWKCRCECGQIVIVQSSHLKNNHTQSCGCFQSEIATKNSTGNTWGRKNEDAKIVSARGVWMSSYDDGCSFEKFMELSQQPCHYCGVLPSNNFNKYLTKEGKLVNKKVSEQWASKANFIYNGLDRIDSTQNHNENNIVACCFRCNRAKDDMTIDEFKIWAERLAHHFTKQK